MRNWRGWWIIIGIIVLVDIYVFSVIRTLTQDTSEKIKIVIYSVYWFISILALVTVILVPSLRFFHEHIILRNYVFAVIIGLFFAKIIASLFFVIDDLRRAIVWLMAKIFPNTGVDFIQEDGGITRSVFLSWMGIGFGSGLLGTLVYGFSNKYNYHVKKIQLAYDNLPAAFKGMKVVQISDIHSGSFTNKKAVEHGVDMILAQNADLILFTGDIVNDLADEMNGYMDVFNKLHAPMGVYSTLGNHDYGDYFYGVNPVGDKATEKANNLKRVKEIHGELGWKLLMNEHVALEKNGESIALIGIENWGAKAGFPKYGRMDLAYPGAEKYPFKILMSHDPSHWDAEVRVKYPDIDLMLSGHTHGMQFGIELPHFKWSPVQWVYKQWAGLYTEGKQQLYVNRGYGFIGYPGRVGILPEITVFEFV
jgi:predicted MPP superfamily phosphohydrolase